MAVIRVPTVLRTHTAGEARVEVDGATVRDLLDGLVERYPGLADRLLEDGAVRGYVNVFVDDEDIRYLEGLDTVVAPGTELAIMPAVAGGSHAVR
jgi:sulfur-carrier protein